MARRFAGAILGILLVVAYGGALLGMALAEPLARIVATGPALILSQVTSEAVVWSSAEVGMLAAMLRILFPMTATLVISAWALGVLNSHRRFFLSYVSPVLWNVAIISAAGLALAGGSVDADGPVQAASGALTGLAWGALVGGVLQLAIQLPSVFQLLGGIRLSVGRGVDGVREAIRNFLPVVAARGVVNLSSLVDVALAAALTAGAVSLIGRAQTLYLLPISLFGMAIAASELPELARSGPEGMPQVAERVRGALTRVSWFLIPSMVAYAAFGDVLVSALFERGEFGGDDARAAGWVLAAYGLGLPASGSSRTLTSAFYALRDTATPARIAVWRIGLSLVVGGALMFPFDRLTVGDFGLGAVGLALGATAGAWLEYLWLRRALAVRVGPHGSGTGRLLGLLGAAIVAGAAGFGAVRGVSLLEFAWPDGAALWGLDHAFEAAIAVGVFGGVYFLLAGRMRGGRSR